MRIGKWKTILLSATTVLMTFSLCPVGPSKAQAQVGVNGATDPFGQKITLDKPKQSKSYTPYAQFPTAKLRIRVIDGRTEKPLKDAEVVLVETEQRYKTNGGGFTPWFDAPVMRNERFRPMVAEMHGQLTAIAYKNGYRDSIHMGIRMHEGLEAQSTIWMYRIDPEDRRIEPVLYQVPYHHIWLIQLADKFRRNSQLGEGWQKP